MSKIRNRSETKKNWNENGTWEGFITLNPHSNCEFRSFVRLFSFLININSARNTIVKIIETVHIIEIFISFV